jgi:HSP20 family protein
VAGRRDIERLQEELDELFESLWQRPRFAGHRLGFRPRVDTFVTDDPPELTIVVELAGVSPEDVHVAVAGDALVVSGRRAPCGPASSCEVSWHQLEIPSGHFERRVRLPESADPEGARATYERGLLTIALPLTAQPPPEGPVAIKVETSR